MARGRRTRIARGACLLLVLGVAIAAPQPTHAATPLPGETEDASVIGPRPTIEYRGRAPWQIRVPSDARRRTEAFADAPSYLPGQTLRIAVSTDRPTYAVAIWHVGTHMELMHRSPLQPGRRQTGLVIDPATMAARADWQWTYAFAIPASWPSGIYLAKVSGSRGAQCYVPFIVRSTRPSRFLFVSSQMNSVAYNRWGGSNLYMTAIGRPEPSAAYAFAVSLDRPFAEEDGAGQLFMLEIPFVEWLARRGEDVTYTTDYDLSLHPEAQPLPRAVLFSGHSEYWTTELRAWLDDHVVRRGDLGLGMFGADAGYWRVRFDFPGSAAGASRERSFGLYKDARLDPGIASRCPAGYTRDAYAFRRSPCGRLDPANLPEAALWGTQYGAIVPGYHPYGLATGVPARLLAGTGLTPATAFRAGEALGAVVGGEVDEAAATETDAVDIVIARAAGLPTRGGAAIEADAVLRTYRSGGRTFASGTFWWAWGLEPHFAAAHGVPSGFGRLTANILDLLAADSGGPRSRPD